MTGSVRLYPDPHLRKPCRPVTTFDGRVAALGRQMLQVMYDANGRGLAAPQLADSAEDWRIFVMDADWKASGTRSGRVCVNPQIVSASEEMTTHEEACLSIPDVPRRVARPARITARWQGSDGKPHEAEMNGAEAVIFQHELDHLDGRLILDHPEVA